MAIRIGKTRIGNRMHGLACVRVDVEKQSNGVALDVRKNTSTRPIDSVQIDEKRPKFPNFVTFSA